MPPRPSTASTAPLQSIAVVRDGSRLSSMNRSDSTSTMTASGTFRKNTARQLTCSTSQPPLTGPIAVVIALNPDQVPIARPRSASSNVALMIARLPGHEEGGADALQRAADDQHARATSRCRTTIEAAVKKMTPSEEHALAAELIAQRSADQDQRAEEQRVGLDRPTARR